MKKIIIVLSLLFIQITNVVAQDESPYDMAIISLANDVANKIKEKKKIKIAVWNFTNTFGKKTAIGDYLGRDFSIHFTNANSGAEVVDRDHLNQILKEHELNEQGFIDPATAKQIGMLIAADAIVTGTVDVGMHSLRIRIKIINTQTGMQIAAALKRVPIDESIKMILYDTGELAPKKIIREKRVNTNENYNSSNSTNSRCESLSIGDYCFENTSDKRFEIKIYGQKNGPFYKIMKNKTVEVNQNVCFLDLPSGSYDYQIRSLGMKLVIMKGSFRVDSCKSLTYKIK